MNGSVTLPCWEMRRIVRVVAPHASDDQDRPIITGVHFVADGDVLTVSASDSYTLARVKVDAPSMSSLDIIVSARWLQRWAKAASKRSTNDVTLKVQGEVVTLDDTGAEETAACKVIGGTFPDLDALLDSNTSEEQTPDTDRAMYPWNLKKALKSLDRWGATATPFRVVGLPEPMKPIRFECVVPGLGRLDMLAMPVRPPAVPT